MLRAASDLQGFTIHATDGNIGHVVEFLFDDRHWVVRYLVADTGGWLSGRRVLISPIALGDVDPGGRRLHVRLTRQQVENSPDIDTDRPVSRQHEISYHSYYGWPYYWGGPGLWGTAMYPGFLAGAPPSSTAMAPPEEPVIEASGEGDPHLRSTKEVMGYRIRATNDEIGHVEDFIIDEETWAIRYLAVDTGSWWPGKKVLIPPQWIGRVSWAEASVEVDLKREVIESGPAWVPGTPVTRELEERLHGYYGRTPYWHHEQRAA